VHAMSTNVKPGDSGGPARPDGRPSWPARFRSSDHAVRLMGGWGERRGPSLPARHRRHPLSSVADLRSAPKTPVESRVGVLDCPSLIVHPFRAGASAEGVAAAPSAQGDAATCLETSRRGMVFALDPKNGAS
jgi:hypothetical protein